MKLYQLLKTKSYFASHSFVMIVMIFYTALWRNINHHKLSMSLNLSGYRLSNLIDIIYNFIKKYYDTLTYLKIDKVS